MGLTDTCVPLSGDLLPRVRLTHSPSKGAPHVDRHRYRPRAHLAKLVDSSAPENKTVRVIQSDDGFGVRFDDPAVEDAVVEHDGKKILIMDQQVSEQLTERTLDTVEQQGGVALTLK